MTTDNSLSREVAALAWELYQCNFHPDDHYSKPVADLYEHEGKEHSKWGNMALKAIEHSRVDVKRAKQRELELASALHDLVKLGEANRVLVEAASAYLTGPTEQGLVMQAWDKAKAALISHPTSSLGRDIFESVLDEAEIALREALALASGEV